MPIAHALQTVSFVTEHGVDWNCPARQSLQFVHVCAPAKVEKVLPAMHEEHAEAPAALNEPAMHGEQTVLRVAEHGVEAKEPAEQGVHDRQAPEPGLTA